MTANDVLKLLRVNGRIEKRPMEVPGLFGKPRTVQVPYLVIRLDILDDLLKHIFPPQIPVEELELDHLAHRALIAMGYTEKEIKDSVTPVGNDLPLEAQVRIYLEQLGGGTGRGPMLRVRDILQNVLNVDL